MADDEIYGGVDLVAEAPYIPTYGEFKLHTGESVRIFRPICLHSDGQDTDDGKYWCKGYDDFTYVSGCVGVTIESRFKSDYFDYDVHQIVAGIGGFAPDLGLVIHGGPIPLKNWTGAKTVINTLVSPHPSGFCNYVTGQAVLGIVKEHGIQTGEMCRVFLDPADRDVTLTGVATINLASDSTITGPAVGEALMYSGTKWLNCEVATEYVASPNEDGADPIYNITTGKPLATISVYDYGANELLYPGNPTTTERTYSLSETGYTVRDEDAITGLIATFWYDPNA